MTLEGFGPEWKKDIPAHESAWKGGSEWGQNSTKPSTWKSSAQALYEEDGDATLLGNCVAISR